MYPFDESAAQFPPQRAEEPVNLRREIVEELRDHLTCARRREQMASGEQTEEAVRRRVLNRFGDPAAVARKLWIDWMWERIMNQRILAATCVLMAVISCVALGLAWASLNRQEDLIATWQSTSETQMRDQQKLFERLLAESQKSKTPSDWNPVELRFVKGKEGGPPADGINVNMSIEANETGIPPMSGVSNKEGIVRFERVRYGTYHFSVRNSAKERFATSFTLQPGEGLSRTVVCPEPPTEPAQLTVRADWTDSLKDKPLWLSFDPDDVYRQVAEERWQASLPWRSMVYRKLLIAPDGALVASRPFLGREVSSTSLRQAYVFPEMGRNSIYNELKEGIQWPGKDYVIGAVEVLIPAPPISSPEQLPQPYDGRPRGNRQTFHAIRLQGTDWTYRIERGSAGKPGTLWLTPTREAQEKVRAAVAEFDQAREATEKARVELDKARAEREQQQPSAAAPDGEKKEGTDDK
jgi:hypothetical protein